MEMNKEGMENGKTCKCSHHWVTPLGIVVVGVVILLGAFGYMDFKTESIVVGILAIGIGITRMFERNCTCC